MNKIKFANLFLLLASLIILSSCKNDEATPDQGSDPGIYEVTQLSDDVTDFFEASPNINADTVWLYAQGGPEENLYHDRVQGFIIDELEFFPNYSTFANRNTSNYLNVAVHQIQTYDSHLFYEDLTIDQVEMEIDLNAEILDRVIKHFKSQGKTVFVFGHSYGAFVLEHYLAQKGNQAADKFIIMGGRLDIQPAAYEAALDNAPHYFPDYVTSTLIADWSERVAGENPIYVRTQLIFTGLIAKPRFTEELANVDMSNVLFAYGTEDTAVGRLSTAEIDFLTIKNVEIVRAEGGHSAMLDAPYNQLIYNWLIH